MVLSHVTQALKQRSPILMREWNVLSTSNGADKVKLMSWNMLAQTLVRRDLFPTSDCLKASQREGMLFNEILTHEADIICLQEADRLEKLIPMLQNASYNHVYANGPGKRHGCIIAYSTSLFEKIGHSVVLYDDLLVNGSVDPECGSPKELTRLTKNVGLVVGLKKLNSSTGLIIATTHLFWHPKFTYERIRQSILLLREIQSFRRQHNLTDWPCIVAGDFNFPPTDPGYSLLVGETLTTDQWKSIDESRVIHVSVDSTFVDSSTIPTATDESADPDVEITDSRSARADDGLLSNEEILTSFQRLALSPLRSAYEEAQRTLMNDESPSPVFGSRSGESFPLRRIGYYEPMWTSYTHYWKSTLDYIFIPSGSVPRIDIQGFLQTPDTSILEPGLPMKDKCGSDHISLVIEIIAN